MSQSRKRTRQEAQELDSLQDNELDVEAIMFYLESSSGQSSDADNDLFYVKWRGKSLAESSWVSRSELDDDMVDEFFTNVAPELAAQPKSVDDKQVTQLSAIQILDEKLGNDGEPTYYLVRWAAHPTATWEPAASVPDELKEAIGEADDEEVDNEEDDGDEEIIIMEGESVAEGDEDDAVLPEDEMEDDLDDEVVRLQPEPVEAVNEEEDEEEAAPAPKKKQKQQKRKVGASRPKKQQRTADSTATEGDGASAAVVPAAKSPIESYRARQTRIDKTSVDETADGFRCLSISTILHILEWYSLPLSRYYHYFLRWLNHIRSKTTRKEHRTLEQYIYGYFRRDPTRTPFLVFQSVYIGDPASVIPLNQKRTLVEDKHVNDIIYRQIDLKHITISRSLMTPVGATQLFERNRGLHSAEVFMNNIKKASVQEKLFISDMKLPALKRLRIGFGNEIDDEDEQPVVLSASALAQRITHLDSVVTRMHTMFPSLAHVDLDDSCELVTMSDVGLEVLFQRMKLESLTMLCVTISSQSLSRQLSRNTTLRKLKVKSSLDNACLDAATRHPVLSQLCILVQQAFVMLPQAKEGKHPSENDHQRALASLPRAVTKDRWVQFITRTGQNHRILSLAFEVPPKVPTKKSSLPASLLQQQKAQFVDTAGNLLNAIAQAPRAITIENLEIVNLPKKAASLWSVQHFQRLNTNAQSLRRLKLVHAGINDAYLTELSKNRFIHELILDHNKTIGDAGVAALFASTGAPNLRRVDLAGCVGVTDKAFASFKAKGAGQALETLVLSQTNVKNAGVVKILSSCTSLKALELFMCRVTDEAFVSLPSNKVLQVLVVAGCVELTDEFLRFASLCTSLQSLNIQFCIKVSEAGYAFLAKSQSLSQLNIATSEASLPPRTFNYQNWITNDCKNSIPLLKQTNLAKLIMSHEQFARQDNFRDLMEFDYGTRVLEFDKNFGLSQS